MADKEKELQEARIIAMLTTNEGWKKVEKHILDNMEPIENRLFNDDLTKEEFDVLQAERRAYKNVLKFVDRRVDKVKKSNN